MSLESAYHTFISELFGLTWLFYSKVLTDFWMNTHRCILCMCTCLVRCFVLFFQYFDPVNFQINLFSSIFFCSTQHISVFLKAVSSSMYTTLQLHLEAHSFMINLSTNVFLYSYKLIWECKEECKIISKQWKNWGKE